MYLHIHPWSVLGLSVTTVAGVRPTRLLVFIASPKGALPVIPSSSSVLPRQQPPSHLATTKKFSRSLLAAACSHLGLLGLRGYWSRGSRLPGGHDAGRLVTESRALLGGREGFLLNYPAETHLNEHVPRPRARGNFRQSVALFKTRRRSHCGGSGGVADRSSLHPREPASLTPICLPTASAYPQMQRANHVFRPAHAHEDVEIEACKRGA